MTSPLSLFTGLSSKSVIDKYKKILHNPPKSAKNQKRGMWNRKPKSERQSNGIR